MCPNDPSPTPHVTPVGTGNEVAVGEVTSGGKYVLLEVPDYDYGRSGNQTSYLRMGLSQTEDYDTAKLERGGDLLDALTNVGPGDQWGGPGNRLFENDRRFRGNSPGANGSAPGDTATVDQRKERSGKIFTNSGWRDHTEGNRVTTTRGDKVEVIGGNYKLIVKGWSDDAGNAAGMDLSGGLASHFDSAPGTITDIRWVPDYNGTWKVYEKTSKGSVDSLYQGDVKELFVGPSVTSQVGEDSGGKRYMRTVFEDEWIEDQQLAKLNPVVTEKTFASSITSYTGSSTTRVPSIKEETWAGTITSSTDASVSISETTHAPSMTEKVTGGSISSTTDVTGPITESTKTAATIDSTTQAANINETTLCAGTITSTSQVGAINERTATGAIVESTIASVHNVTEVIGVTNEVSVGVKTGVQVGTVTEIFAGAKVELNLAASTSFSLLSADFTIGNIVTAVNDVKANANFANMSATAKFVAFMTSIGI